MAAAGGGMAWPPREGGAGTRASWLNSATRACSAALNSAASWAAPMPCAAMRMLANRTSSGDTSPVRSLGPSRSLP